MADPTNPNNPVDPGVGAQFNDMAEKMRGWQSWSDNAKKVADEAERSTNAIHKNAEAIKKEVDGYKDLTKVMKRIAVEMKSQGKEASIIREELEKVVEAHESALKNERQGSKEYKTMRDNLHKVRKELELLPRAGKVMEEQVSRINDMMEDLATNVKNVAKAMANLGRTGAVIRGFAGVAEAMGFGRPATAIDRKLEKIENIKQAAEDARDLRKAATTKHMKTKRAKAIDQLGAAQKRGGGWVDPETGSVMDFIDEKGKLTSGGQKALARKLKFKPGTDKYDAFMGGEADIAAGGEGGAGWASAMASGGGGMEMLTTALEGVETGLMEFAPEIMILIEAISLLAELFGSYTKQNKEMEKSLGKGGMFTQPGVGAGSAFMNTRNALLPGGGDMGSGGMFLGAGLGINWERNLAIAGQLADQGGMGIVPSMTQGANTANMGPGAMGEFGKGAFGEIQRVVMGAGRVGGLTDQEGVGEVIKLLGQYRETIASSEDFMNQLNKDTAAAGISTTKYLKIIDEVSSHFDRMGKSLEQVTGVMREMSRYGAVSSDSLKDMMEFLEGGMQKTNMGNVQTAAFTHSVMDKDTLKSLRETEQQSLANYVDAFNAEKPAGMAGLDISSAINKKDFAGAQGIADQMRSKIQDVAKTDPVKAQAMQDALSKVQDQINRYSGVMSEDYLKRAGSEGMYKEDSAQTIAKLFTSIRYSANASGAGLQKLMSGGGTGEASIMVQQLSELLGVKAGGFSNVFELLRNEAQNRVTDVRTGVGGPDTQKKNARVLFGEIYKGAKTKEGIATYLTSKGLGGFFKKNSEDALGEVMSTNDGMAALAALFQTNLETIAASGGTQDKILKENAAGNKQDAKSIANTISQARGIALRTQSVEELLANTFKPLMIKLVYGVEKLVTTVLKWFSDDTGDNPPEVEDPAAQMKKVSDSVNTLNKQLDDGQKEMSDWNDQHMKDGKFDTKASKEHAQELARTNAIGADTLKQLETSMQSGVVGSDVMDAVTKISAGQKGVGIGDTASKIVVNNFYSANATMDVQQPASASTSTDHPVDSARQPATKGVGKGSN